MSAKRGLTKMSGPEGKTGQNQKRGIRLNSLSNNLIPGDQEDQGLEKNVQNLCKLESYISWP